MDPTHQILIMFAISLAVAAWIIISSMKVKIQYVQYVTKRNLITAIYEGQDRIYKEKYSILHFDGLSNVQAFEAKERQLKMAQDWFVERTRIESL